MGTPHEESSGLLPEALKAIAGPVASTALGIGTAALGRSWSNQDWKNQTAALNRQAIDNARNSPLYLVDGLRRAGLNPALAAQGQYTPAPVESAPMQQHNMPVSPIDLTQMELVKANANLAQSQADKNEAETRDLEIDIKRKGYEDATHAENFHAFFGARADEREKELREYWKSQGKSDSEIGDIVSKDSWYRYYIKMQGRSANKGSSQAFRDFTQMVREDRQAAYEIVHYALHCAIEKGQLNKSVLDKLINEPKLNWKEKEHRIGLMLAQSWSSFASGDATYHKDLAAMIKNKDKLGALLYASEEAVDFIEHMSPLMIVKALRGAKGSKLSPTTQKAFDALRGTTTPKGLTGNHDF